MEVPEALVVTANKRHRIAATVGVVAGVQAQPHHLRIGLLQQQLDLVFAFDMGFGIGVENQLQTKAGAGDFGDFVSGLDQAFPGAFAQPGRAARGPRVQIEIGLVDQHQKVPAQGGHQLAAAHDLALELGPRRRLFQIAFHYTGANL